MLPQAENPIAGSQNLVNVFTNDPNAKGLSLRQLAPPAGTSSFQVPGWLGTGGLYDPGTAEFEAGSLHYILNHTYAVWCDFFGKNPAWQPGTAQLAIFPRAGKDFNAYYDRRGLKFFYNLDPVTRQTIYTCESSDVVAHECGHAILDCEHPDYWDSLLGETAAFHEAFGDMSAILVTLQDPCVRTAILAENNGDLTKSNAVSRLAEQLARGVFNSGHPDAVASADALRDAVNSFKYRDPDKLPARAPASRLSSESHSFSRVFSGAFYDLLTGIYQQLRQGDPELSADAGLAQASAVAGHLLAQGLILAPKGDAAFKTIAASMFKADAQSFDGSHYAALKQVFVGRRILKAREASALRATGGAGHTETSVLGGTASASVGVPQPLGVAGAQVGREIPSEVRRTLRLRKTDYRLVEERTKRDFGAVLHYVAPREIQLKGGELGVARGAVVTVMDAVALDVDPDGNVISSNHHKVDRGQEQRIHDHVTKLVERGRVYAAQPGESVDPGLLIERKQPYYIAYDQEGKKRIQRGFIACNL